MILCVRSEISTVRSWYVRLVGEEVRGKSLSADQRVAPFMWYSPWSDSAGP